MDRFEIRNARIRVKREVTPEERSAAIGRDHLRGTVQALLEFGVAPGLMVQALRAGALRLDRDQRDLDVVNANVKEVMPVITEQEVKKWHV